MFFAPSMWKPCAASDASSPIAISSTSVQVRPSRIIPSFTAETVLTFSQSSGLGIQNGGAISVGGGSGAGGGGGGGGGSGAGGGAAITAASGADAGACACALAGGGVIARF